VLCPIVDCGFDRLDEHQTAGLPRMGKNVFSAIAFKARFRQERRRFGLTRRPSRHTAGAPNAHQAGHRSCSETRRGTARVGTNHRVAAILDSSEYQFAERDYKAGEELTTTSWPHPSFRPLNYSACRVLEFFNSRMKSRLPLRPWRGGRIDLDDGWPRAA
jgi:hypothetical protein